MKIGEKIKCIRKEKNITQKELAKRVGISNTYLSDIERTRTNPSLKVLQRIADSLKTNAKELL